MKKDHSSFIHTVYDTQSKIFFSIKFLIYHFSVSYCAVSDEVPLYSFKYMPQGNMLQFREWQGKFQGKNIVMHGLEENSLLSANLWAGMGGENLLSAVGKKPLIKVCCRVRIKKKIHPTRPIQLGSSAHVLWLRFQKIHGICLMKTVLDPCNTFALMAMGTYQSLEK